MTIEETKPIFQRRFDELRRYAEHTKIFDYLFAMQQLGSVYAEIFGISYTQAMIELCGEPYATAERKFAKALCVSEKGE